MRILVVDDNIAVRSIVKRGLRSAGIDLSDVAEAGTGLEALHCLRARPFDLVLSDLNMPQLNGLELLAVIRQEAIPVAFGLLTVECEGDGLREDALRAGANFVMAKPFTMDHFREAIASVRRLRLDPAWLGPSSSARLEEPSRFRRPAPPAETDARDAFVPGGFASLDDVT